MFCKLFLKISFIYQHHWPKLLKFAHLAGHDIVKFYTVLEVPIQFQK